jgi:hypothetical protein
MILTLHVSFVIEIRHLPTVLFVIVVVSVRAVMRWCYRLGVRRRCTVIKVHLRAILIGRWSQHLLRFPLSGRPIEREKDIVDSNALIPIRY